MIMINLFSKFFGCCYIDFISVHYCRYDIVSTEFFFDEMIGFFIKLLCVFVTTVIVLLKYSPPVTPRRRQATTNSP